MRKWLLLLAAFLTLAGMLSACNRNNPQTTATPPSAPPPPPVILRIHFAGADQISSNTNSLAFTNEFASTEAHALESQTLDKLSRAPGVWFKSKLPAGAGDGSAQLRPLLDDFLKSEWVFEMRGRTDSPEYALAIRLDDAGARLWETNLQNLLESWTKITVQNISNGWELKKDLPPNLLRFDRTNGWVIIGCGQNELPLADEWVQSGMTSSHEPGWLSVLVDWQRLGQVFPALAKFDFPATSMQAIGMNGNFLVNGKFELSQPLPALDQWQIPTNLIHQPLSSFTAARGFGPWLQNQSWARLFGLSPEPNQLYSWTLASGPMEGYTAFPVPNATNELTQIDQNLTANTNWQKHFLITFQKTVTTNRISWQGFPFISPEIRALQEANGDFLLMDVFPIPPFGRPVPSELYEAFRRDKVVFYHWEITAPRLKALPELTQFALVLTKHRQFEMNSAAGRWLSAIGPTLGNSVTEAEQTGPSELTFTRTAPAGLTAVELIALANWLEAPNFPGCDLSLPSHARPHGHVKTLSAPVPVPAGVAAPMPPKPH